MLRCAQAFVCCAVVHRQQLHAITNKHAFKGILLILLERIQSVDNLNMTSYIGVASNVGSKVECPGCSEVAAARYLFLKSIKRGLVTHNTRSCCMQNPASLG